MTMNERFAVMSAYMRARAKAERAAYSLTPAFFQVGFEQVGVREFFGFQTDDQGDIIYDSREPSPGFLAGFLARSDLPALVAAEPKTTRTSLAKEQRLYRTLPVTIQP